LLKCKICYKCHLLFFFEERDKIYNHCIKKGIEVKIHYPIPIYLQKALSFMNHKKGDFPITDSHCDKIITFPCDQHLSKTELDYVVSTVKGFYT